MCTQLHTRPRWEEQLNTGSRPAWANTETRFPNKTKDPAKKDLSQKQHTKGYFHEQSNKHAQGLNRVDKERTHEGVKLGRDFKHTDAGDVTSLYQTT